MLDIADSLFLGAHISIAGGLYTSFARAERIGCTAMQIFTKNSSRWREPAISSDEVSKFKAEHDKSKVKVVISHCSYLVNLCSATDRLLEASRKAFIEEIKRCAVLGIRYLIFHPGARTTMEKDEAIRLVADSLNYSHEATPECDVITVVETTAGQGTTVGSTFEEIAGIISNVKNEKRVGVCIDTCHIFASGYDIRTSECYEATIGEFDKTIGLNLVCAIHFNDAKKTLGSRVDRHEHIGKGKIGKAAFGFFMNDERFSKVPKILETPKGEDGYKMDIVNLKILLSTLKPRV
jgi:deoxyribonuclease-4